MIIDVTLPLWLYPVLVWTIAWKAVGAWTAARKGHLIWFVSFFVFNTMGILPIVYIFFFQKLDFSKKKSLTKKKFSRKKKAPTL